MSALQQYIDFYKQNRESVLANAPEAMNALRPAALASLETASLPRKGDEDYETTDLEQVFAPNYGINIHRVDLGGDPAEAFRCNVPNMSTWIYYFYGDVFHSQHKSPSLPADVVIEPFSVAAHNHPQLLAAHLGKTASVENAVTALNTLLAQDGLLVYVPDGVRLDRPIQLVNLVGANGDIMALRRLLIVTGRDAEAKILVCDHTQNKDHNFLISQVVEIEAGEGSHLQYYDLEESTERTHRCTSHYVRQSQGSSVLLNGITLTGGFTRNDYIVNVDGEGADTRIYGMAIEDGCQHVDNHTRLNHHCGHCTSDQLFKYVLMDRSTGAFTGKILVSENAPGVEAYQANRNILASDLAKMHTKPQLEIYTDDVKCSHGTAIGQLDKEAIFYMQARGIPYEQARTMLMQAFMNDVILTIHPEALRDRLQRLVEKRFSGELSACRTCSGSCHDLSDDK